jgi:Alpha/beta hydrolase domain
MQHPGAVNMTLRFWIYSIVSLALAGCSNGSNGSNDLSSPMQQPTAIVSGPITSGSRGFAATPAPGDLAAAGYVKEEFFIEGVARAFEQRNDWSIDGIRFTDKLYKIAFRQAHYCN